MEERLEKLTEILDPLLNRYGCELYSLKLFEQGGLTLQLMLDHPDGVTLELCEKVSREFSVLLDVEDPVSSKYRLEVSSPGIFRELRNEADYRRFQNNKVKASFWNEANDKIMNVKGKFTNFDEQNIWIEKKKGEVFEISRNRLKTIKLNPSF